MTTVANPYEILDQIDTVATNALNGLKQFTAGQRQLLQLMGGMFVMNGTPRPVQPIAQPVASPTPASPTPAALPAATASSTDESRGVPDITKIRKRGRRKNASQNTASTAESTPSTDALSEAQADATQPSLRSVVWNILNRPDYKANGLRAGGDAPSILQIIIDEKLWVSKRNGNMPSLIQQCLHTLKKQGKVTRNHETHCFVAKDGVNLDD